MNSLSQIFPSRLGFLSLCGLTCSALATASSLILTDKCFSINRIGLSIILCGISSGVWKVCFNHNWSTWWRAQFLGFTLASGCIVALKSSIPTFGWYMVVMSVFHYSEYYATAVTNPSNLSTDSFLLNHSWAYGIAAAVSWMEYFVELYFFPSMKHLQLISQCGLLMCFGGEILRKLAMIHAGRSFNHIVQSSKRDDHQLVTSGVFSLMRHPSYVGWFYWSIGTQVILCNPISLIGYTAASWMFFNERIYVEEYTLLRFFGEDYFTYQQKVPIGIPFIKGYKAL